MVTKSDKIPEETTIKITKWVLEELRKYKKSDRILNTRYKADKDIIDNLVLDYLQAKGAIKKNRTAKHL
jgi:hypothetical protein